MAHVKSTNWYRESLINLILCLLFSSSSSFLVVYFSITDTQDGITNKDLESIQFYLLGWQKVTGGSKSWSILINKHLGLEPSSSHGTLLCLVLPPSFPPSSPSTPAPWLLHPVFTRPCFPHPHVQALGSPDKPTPSGMLSPWAPANLMSHCLLWVSLLGGEEQTLEPCLSVPSLPGPPFPPFTAWALGHSFKVTLATKAWRMIKYQSISLWCLPFSE